MSSIFEELKRRNVFKVGVAYAIVAWMLVQITSIVAPALHLPDWTLTLIILLVILGLPIALFLAWAYELTPEGIKHTQPIISSEGTHEITGQKLNYVIIGLLSLAVIFLIIDNYVLVNKTGVEKVVVEKQTERPATVAVAENPGKVPAATQPATNIPAFKSIAVLPFTDLSPNKDQGYFADGLTEELLNKLAQVQDLQVTARTSSFYFKGKNEDVRTIGEMLGVAHLLEGSVRKDGNRLRITAQLIKVADGNHLWSKTYDRDLTDIFTVQDEIGKAVTTALSVTLGAGVFNRPGMTRNIKAYELYLRAQENFTRYTPDSLLTAIDQAEQAVSIDPSFGLGWLGLNTLYNTASNIIPPEQAVNFEERGANALIKAQAVAPDMPGLLTIKAHEYDTTGHMLEADRIYKQILNEHGHADATINQQFGLRLSVFGRATDALTYLQRAKRLNPLDSLVSFNLSTTLLNLNRLDASLAEIRYGQTLNGYEVAFNAVEWLIALENNDKSKACTIIKAFYALDGDYPNAKMLRLAELLVSDDKKNSLAELEKIAADPDITPFTGMAAAHIASELDDPELALKIIKKYYRSENAIAIWHPVHKKVRQLPAFKSYLRDLGLVDYWRATGNWGDFCHPVGDDDFECK